GAPRPGAATRVSSHSRANPIHEVGCRFWGRSLRGCAAHFGTKLSRLFVASFFVISGVCLSPLQARQCVPPKAETGYVTSKDGVRLYYAKVGSGTKSVIIVPGRLFTFRDFQPLAKRRTLIFYDMRDRGHSDAVADNSKISLQHDVEDLEAVRAHFGIEKPDL